MESREKNMSEEPIEDDPKPDEGCVNPDDDDADDPSLDSLGRPVSGSRMAHGAYIGLVQKNIMDTVAFIIPGLGEIKVDRGICILIESYPR